MKSDPQLRQDINKLQAENRELRERVKELESRPVKVVEKPVEKVVTKRVEVSGPVQYVDNPALIRQIEKMRGKLNAGN